MEYKNKSKEELIIELQELQQKINSTVEYYEAEIASRRNIEEELKINKELLYAIVNGTTDVIYLKNLAGQYILFNHAAEQFTGKTSSVVLGKNDSFLFLAEEAEIIMKADQNVIINNSISTFEEYVTDVHGKKVTLLSTKGPIYDSKGTVLGLFGIARDITERKESEKILLKNSRILQLFIENVPASIAMFDSEMRYLAYSRRFLIDYDLGELELSGLSHYDIFPEMPERWKEIHRRCLAGATEKCDEDIFPRANGKTDWVRWTIIPWHETDEKIGGIILFSEVITLQKQAEILLKEKTEQLESQNEEYKSINEELYIAKDRAEETAKKLSETEKRLKLKLDYILSPEGSPGNLHLTDIVDLEQLQKIQEAFVKATNVASVITDLSGVPITKPSNFSGICNLIRQTEKGRQNCFNSDKSIGLKAGELLKPTFEICHSCGFVDAGAPIIVAGKQIAIWMIGQSNTGVVDNKRIENYAIEIGADKTEMLKEYSMMPNMSVEQFEHVTNLLWILAQEISSLAYNNLQLAKKIEERKEVEKELILEKEKAEESDRLKTAFLQNMSHEIRTPMNAIMGFSEILVNQFNNKEKFEKFSQIIRQRSSDLLDIINDILDISKIESGQLPVNFEECNLDELFGELNTFFTEYQSRLNKQHLKFNILPLSKTLHNNIITDKVKLKQIFINLITNAFKFTDEGKIEIGCKPDAKNNILFFVSDTGLGIPPEKQKAIFERFIQLNQNHKRNIGGTGLGLSIVKGLVNILGGEIFLESEICKGSTFTFTIKYKAIDHLDKVVLINDTNSDLMNEFAGKTILIVEDDSYNADYLKEVITSKGLKSLMAENGKDAIEISLNQQVDLVLMDICLPDIDGYEAARQIKKHKPNMKIIAQTAYASKDDEIKALEAGCNDYIAKPIKSEALLSMIIKHLAKK